MIKLAIRRSILLLLCITAAPALHPVVAQSTGDGDVVGAPYSLNQCISYALRNQKSIDIARFDAYIAQKQVKEFTGIGLPQVSASAGFSQYGTIPKSVIDAGRFSFDPNQQLPANVPDSLRFFAAEFGLKYGANVGGQVSQLLFDGSFFVGLKAARAFVDLNEINVQRTEIETAVAVTKAYWGALVNEERAKLLNANLDRLKKLVDNTRALFEQGFVEKVDVDRLQIAYNNLQMEREKVNRMVDLGYDLLKFQMGMDVDTDIYLKDRITDEDKLPSIESVSFDGEYHDNRIEMVQLEQGIRLQELDVKRNRMGTFGSLVAFGTVGYQTFRPRFFDLDIEQTWFPSSQWGLSYNVTLFDGLQKSARIQRGELEIAKIEAQMDIFRQSVKLQVRSAGTSVLNAWNDVETSRENKDLAAEVYRISTTKYGEGIGTNLEVIDAENTLLQSQINYLSALYDYILANVELRRVKGDIKPDEILNRSNGGTDE